MLLTLPAVILSNDVAVSGNGKGDGSSSTESECGFVTGPGGVGPVPFVTPLGYDARGVGGGDVPSLLRSLRVMCGRDWESRAASVENVSARWHYKKSEKSTYR